MLDFFAVDSNRSWQAAALISETATLTWADLLLEMDRFCADVRDHFSMRPLLMLEATNEPGAVIPYLAALRAGWPILPVAPDTLGEDSTIRRTFQPNVVIRSSGAEWNIEICDAPPVELHSNLSVLLSTSGTTGAAKLVRLSRDNLLSNAAAIIEYLGITAADRAITALPFHYSYGMSVMHTQMLAGAPLILTERSVSEPEFWALARKTEATSLALVPTQIATLETSGWNRTRIPTLRYMTQAGGRLDPALARRFAKQAHADNWKLFLMYGQTEAGPRMAYLPPEDILDNIGSIGKAIPNGRFRLTDADGRDIEATNQAGDLVFEGPGVMQGYALTRGDLAAPAGLPVLNTGDIAERLCNGYFRILGRKSRFLKLHGLRIGLDEVEVRLREDGIPVYATGSDDIGLVLFLEGGTEDAARSLADEVSRQFHLPRTLVQATPLQEVPLLSSGKIDYRSLTERSVTLAPPPTTKLDELLAQVLRDASPDMARSFRDLGGDSLGYLSVQLYFAERKIPIPEDWDSAPLSRLATLKARSEVDGSDFRCGGSWIEADLFARVVALFAVIALHATAWPTGGGAFLLLTLTGYSVARFQFMSLGRGQVGRVLVTMLLPILIAYYVLILGTHLIWRPLPLQMFFLIANYDPAWADPEPYWFVSTYVQLLLLLSIPFLIPAVCHKTASAPLVAGLVGLAVAAVAFEGVGLELIPSGIRLRHPIAAFELAAMGWCTWFANSVRQRIMISLIIVLVWQLHWSDLPPGVAVFCFAGLLAVLWRLKLPAPAWALYAVTLIGSLVMYSYIAHAAMISMAHRLLPSVSDLPRFVIVLSASLMLAYGLRRFYYEVLMVIAQRLSHKIQQVSQRKDMDIE